MPTAQTTHGQQYKARASIDAKNSPTGDNFFGFVLFVLSLGVVLAAVVLLDDVEFVLFVDGERLSPVSVDNCLVN